ncbi:MAG TPA: hypothetical protein VFI40_04810 [Nocardioides sp.]|nr:hypothetical protein [Nocardioides sp.]
MRRTIAQAAVLVAFGAVYSAAAWMSAGGDDTLLAVLTVALLVVNIGNGARSLRS